MAGLGVLPFATGLGLIRLGGAGLSVDWRRRAEGLITELERILVPYWCCAVCVDFARDGQTGDGVAAGASMRHES